MPTNSEALLLDKLKKAELRIKNLSSEIEYWNKRAIHSEKELKSFVQRTDFIEELTKSEPENIVYKIPKKITSGSATACIGCSDWHIGEVVDPKKVNNLNKYNLDIADKRITQLWEKSAMLIESRRSISKIEDAVIWLGGDLMTGYIHEELMESNSLSPIQEVMWLTPRIENGILYILNTCKLKYVRIICNVGNHGRTTPKKKISTLVENSYEWLMYHFIAQRMQLEKRVHWEIADGYFALADIQNIKTRWHHGDQINYYGGVGGVTIPLNKAIAEWNKANPSDLDFYGHFHQWLRQWKSSGNGSLIGYTPHALSIKAGYQPPVQNFVVLDRKRGMVTCEPIFVDTCR